MIQTEGITKSFGSLQVLKGIDLTIGEGEIVAIVGPSGAGKTTLMRMLCTIIRPTEGKIRWNGKDIFELGETYRGILGYLPQEFGYYPDMSIYDYLMYIQN